MAVSSRVAVSRTDHVTSGKERAGRSNQLSCSCLSLSSPPISRITMAESSLRSRAKNRRQPAQVDLPPDDDEDGHPQQDPVRCIQLRLTPKTSYSSPISSMLAPNSNCSWSLEK